MDTLWEIFKTIQVSKICNESFCSIKSAGKGEEKKQHNAERERRFPMTFT
jgi:hypothetical protein